MNRFSRSIVLICTLIVLYILAGCAPTPVSTRPPPSKKPATQRPYTIGGKTYYPIDSADGYWERGKASWYGKPFHGRKTSNGETYNMYDMTAAHKTLPMNTVLLVRNLENGRETVVRINDRGPFVKGRIIDLSYAAAQKIDVVGKGVAMAEIIAMGEATGPARKEEIRPGQLRHQDFYQGNYYIQVGSFLNRSNAEQVARLFLNRGVRVVIQPYITSGYTYYRVQVFAGTLLQVARIFEQQLLRSGYPGAFLIAR